MPVAYYISAHQDDWQLFRGRQARIDVTDASNYIVFIYATAGNVNRDDGSNLDGWWEAREFGALESCRYLTGPNHILRETVLVGGRPITKCTCGNTISYFMRIDDNDFASLVDGGNARAMDGSAQYDWTDFVQTLKAILALERRGQDHPWINTSEFEDAIDPGNNPSHIAVGKAVMEATAGVSPRALWRSYSIAGEAVNLSPEDAMSRRELFFAYNSAVTAQMDAGGEHVDDYENNPTPYDSWFGKEYARSLG